MAIALAGSSQIAMSQSNSAGPLVLRLPASARLLGMANAGLAANDGDALFYNPASLNSARGSADAFSLQRYGSFGTLGSLGSVNQVGALNVGVGVQFLEWSARPLSYRALMHDGATQLSDSGGTPASSTAFTVGLARVYRGRRVGVNIKYVEDRLSGRQDGTVAFDAGLVMPFGPATLAFTVQNVGQGLRMNGETSALPTLFGIGWGGGMYSRFEKWDMGWQTQLTVEHGGFVRPAGGMEFGYVPIEGVSFIVRGGVRAPREKDEGFGTGGLGISLDRFSLDYAIEPFRNGRTASHRVGVRIR